MNVNSETFVFAAIGCMFAAWMLLLFINRMTIFRAHEEIDYRHRINQEEISRILRSVPQYPNLEERTLTQFDIAPKDEIPFLKTIEENQGSPGPYGVYADYLEEKGDYERAARMRQMMLRIENGDPRLTEEPRWSPR